MFLFHANCFPEIEQNKLHCMCFCTPLRTCHEAQCHIFPVVRTGGICRFVWHQILYIFVYQNMDTLLRCPICFEFLNITMMTQCSHNCTYYITFTLQFIHFNWHNFSKQDTKLLLLFFLVFQTVCSLCIRKFLSFKLLCPVCNSVSVSM